MDIENQIIRIKVTNFNQEHYVSLGYDAKNGDFIFVRAKDLPDGSGTKVDVECSFCHKIFKKAWRRYLETRNGISCNDCKKYKIMETSYNKYGYTCSLKNESVGNKRKATWDMKYGTDKNPLSCDYIREKAMQTMVKNGTVSHAINTSKQQIYLCNLYKGKLNYSIDKYIVDALLPNNVVFEYDGYGHDMSVRMEQVKEDDFNKREAARQNEIINLGYKVFRLKYMNKKDKLPYDKILLCIIDRAYYMFGKGYTFYSYDLQTRIESYNK